MQIAKTTRNFFLGYSVYISKSLIQIYKLNEPLHFLVFLPQIFFQFFSDGPFQRLNKKQRQFYEDNGFLVVPNLVPHEMIDECKEVAS